ncbi:MvaI/BcnI family restriction endonuclease [Cellvibrio sp. NN19]|uniref:MvaI/BcnI family restriction endonuclease n=1 Tax=Cellvibrio chitinivorans TaxID=3102792 RepID=UPI002B403A17|nr:MvaI/BcnI family restriction endonuclease [Cellvibrio sp. NN19]
MPKDDIGTYDSQASKEINLTILKKILIDNGVDKIYVKKLSPNDNSKNQPYLGGDLTELSFIPTDEIEPSITSSTKKSKTSIKFQASLHLEWITPEGNCILAPHAKLIYYPQYPEVRLSGFLRNSKVNISKWMAPQKQGRSEGRWLIFGVCNNKKIYAYLVTPESNLANELSLISFKSVGSVLSEIEIDEKEHEVSTKDSLIRTLLNIHSQGWISSRKLNADLTYSNYSAPNGGGYTLESLLNIYPNGFSEPDYMGWEVKQFGVSKFPSSGAKPTTLMTPEPNGGIYVEKGPSAFIQNYGYPDKSGIQDRYNFGGKHTAGKTQNLTNLTMQILGFDEKSLSIIDPNGSIALIDKNDQIAASWSFAKLIDHWKRKHSQAVYVPCLSRINTVTGLKEYHFGNNLELGEGTNFEVFLAAVQTGTIFYDPGIKMENASSTSPKIKRRSQFRVNHKDIKNLYNKYEILNT